MEDRETHYLCVFPPSTSFPSLFSLIKQKNFRILHIKTAGESFSSSYCDIRKGDTVMEIVGLKDCIEKVDKTQVFSSIKSKLDENSSSNIDFLDLNRSISLLNPLISLLSLPLDEIKRVFLNLKSNFSLLSRYRPSGQFAMTETDGDYCGLLILKPSVFLSNSLDEVISTINQRGFIVINYFSFHFTYTIAEDFFAAYKGNVENYSEMIDDICSGTSLALGLIRQEYQEEYNNGGNLSNSRHFIENLRDLAGPFEPRLARVLRPESLRAKYGKNSTKNGIHVTDLVGDGERECQFIFELVGGL